VATTNAILWEGCRPIFVDIDPLTCCIDANKIEAAITERTQAILATHVYGIPCDVEAIEIIAIKHGF
jgi:dTDP-4-amino-4,6-dideoxygalactose transaminase